MYIFAATLALYFKYIFLSRMFSLNSWRRCCKNDDTCYASCNLYSSPHCCKIWLREQSTRFLFLLFLLFLSCSWLLYLTMDNGKIRSNAIHYGCKYSSSWPRNRSRLKRFTSKIHTKYQSFFFWGTCARELLDSFNYNLFNFKWIKKKKKKNLIITLWFQTIKFWGSNIQNNLYSLCISPIFFVLFFGEGFSYYRVIKSIEKIPFKFWT